MLIQLFSNYLLRRNLITSAQLNQVLEIKKVEKLPLGAIALSEGFMTDTQVEHANRIQAKTNKRFGDIAVENGYITTIQLSILLSSQSDDDTIIYKILTEANIMSKDDIDTYMEQFKEFYELTEDDFEKIASNEVETCIEKIGGISRSNYFFEFATAFVNMVVRFIDRDVILQKHYFSDRQNFKYLILQSCVDVDQELVTGYGAVSDDIINFSSEFARSKFENIDDEDSHDSLKEFLNCVSGIFIGLIEKNRYKDFDLRVPNYNTNKTMTDFSVLPIITKYGQIYLTFKE